MKKLTLIVILISLFQVIKAQETTFENKSIVGGSISFLAQNNAYPYSTGLSITSGIGGIFSNNTNEIKNTTFSISPYFGREINRRLILGLEIDYRLGRYKLFDANFFGTANLVDFERNSNQFGMGFFTRHLLNPGKQLGLFIQPYFEYNLLNQKEKQDADITQEQRSSYIELGVGAGLLYNINDRMRLLVRTGGMNYVNGKWKIVDTDIEQKFSSFGTRLSLSAIYFGFEIKL